MQVGTKMDARAILDAGPLQMMNRRLKPKAVKESVPKWPELY